MLIACLDRDGSIMFCNVLDSAAAMMKSNDLSVVLQDMNLTAAQLQRGFAQWSVGNFNNVCTLSGKGSLHAMDIVCSVTSQSGRMTIQSSLLKR